jgi:hypothetical protein
MPSVTKRRERSSNLNSQKSAIANRKYEGAGSRIRTDDLLITNATVIWAFVIVTYVNSDSDNPSQPSKSVEIPSQWQYLAATINACFARKERIVVYLVLRTNCSSNANR